MSSVLRVAGERRAARPVRLGGRPLEWPRAIDVWSGGWVRAGVAGPGDPVDGVVRVAVSEWPRIAGWKAIR